MKRIGWLIFIGVILIGATVAGFYFTQPNKNVVIGYALPIMSDQQDKEDFVCGELLDLGVVHDIEFLECSNTDYADPVEKMVITAQKFPNVKPEKHEYIVVKSSHYRGIMQSCLNPAEPQHLYVREMSWQRPVVKDRIGRMFISSDLQRLRDFTEELIDHLQTKGA